MKFETVCLFSFIFLNFHTKLNIGTWNLASYLMKEYGETICLLKHGYKWPSQKKNWHGHLNPCLLNNLLTQSQQTV